MPKRRRGLLIFVSLLGGVFVLAQLFRPELSNPPVTADLSAPAPVKAILRRSCYDCHSNETRLPWFDRIVPAYW
ncbi:MAG TPA: heme-binding domain-containing protein, partial [Polyangiaceae bacterium]